MTSTGDHSLTLGRIEGPVETANMLHGILLHEAWASAYGKELTPERKAQSHLRSARRMFDLLASSSIPVTEARSADSRLVGTCRHFSVLACATLKAQGIPSRARCGFGMYFESGKGVDHWVVEYWNGKRWVVADFQIEDVQASQLGLVFDLLDLPEGKFLTAGEAWRLCRDAKADPDTFGIFDEGGLWFIAMNLVRDVAALNNMEMLPWDDWGIMPKPNEDISTDRMKLFDRLAALTTGGVQTDEIRALYLQEAGLRVPQRVFNALRQQEEEISGS
jgi:hypothetical protein